MIDKLKNIGILIALFFLALVFYFTMFLTTLFIKIELFILRNKNG